MRTVDSTQTFVHQFSYQNLRLSKQDTESQASVSEKQHIHCDDYSFNQQPSQSIRHRSQVYMPGSLDESEPSMTLPELARKYSSIYEQLKDVEASELMHLFLEEMEDHQKTRKKLIAAEVQAKSLQEELAEMKQLLNKKRESIAQLCQTESQHLNTIEQLEGQMKNGCFSAEGHFQKKYKQLQTCMNEYIASTNQAQQQFCKRLKLLKNQNSRLLQQIEQQNSAMAQQNTKMEVISSKFERLNKIIGLGKQKEVTFTIKIDNLEEECNTMRKQNEALREKVRNNQEFEVELTKENRELSSQLDFIREKINQNQDISKDIFEKIEEQNEHTNKITKELEKVSQERDRLEYQNSKMVMLLQQTQREREQQLKNRKTMASHFDEMNEQFQKLRVEMGGKSRLNEQMKQHLDRLKEELQQLTSEHEQLLAAYEQEKEDKELIKGELLNLAEQVRYMQQTYQKQVSQNQRIKGYLQKYWQRREQPLTQMSLNLNRANFESEREDRNGSKHNQSKDSLNVSN